jgi:hypothetical protein
MKNKIIVLTVFLGFVMGTHAQSDAEFVNKNGAVILPQSGDIAIGISLNPIFSYFGNFFSKDNGISTSSSIPVADFLSYPVGINDLYISSQAPTSSQIYAKYFLEDDRAIRASFEFTGINHSLKLYVQDDAAILDEPSSNAKVEDMQHIIGSTMVVGAGYEIRRGHRRLQGFMGGSAFFLMQNDKSEFSYGNPISDLNPDPSSVNWGNNLLSDGGRKTMQNYGQTLGIGVGGFIGVELFIMPKMSLGAELGYGYMYYKQKQTKYEFEIWNVNTVENNIETLSPGYSGHVWGTGNPAANFFLMFHF